MSRLKKNKLACNRFNKDSDVCKRLVDKTNVESGRSFPTPDLHYFTKRSCYNDNQSLKTPKLLCDDIVIETKGHSHKFCCTEEATEENLFSAFKRIGNGLWYTILCYKTDWYEKI